MQFCRGQQGTSANSVDVVNIGSCVRAGGHGLPGHGLRPRVSSRVPPATATTDPSALASLAQERY